MVSGLSMSLAPGNLCKADFSNDEDDYEIVSDSDSYTLCCETQQQQEQQDENDQEVLLSDSSSSSISRVWYETLGLLAVERLRSSDAMQLYTDSNGDLRVLLCLVLGWEDMPFSDFRARPWTLVRNDKKVFLPDKEMLSAEVRRRQAWMDATAATKQTQRIVFPRLATKRALAEWLQANPRPTSSHETEYFSKELQNHIRRIPDLRA